MACAKLASPGPCSQWAPRRGPGSWWCCRKQAEVWTCWDPSWGWKPVGLPCPILTLIPPRYRLHPQVGTILLLQGWAFVVLFHHSHFDSSSLTHLLVYFSILPYKWRKWEAWSTREKWREDSISIQSASCDLQRSYLSTRLDILLLWGPFPTCVQAGAASSWMLSPCRLLQVVCSGPGTEAVVDTVLLLTVFCPLLFLFLFFVNFWWTSSLIRCKKKPPGSLKCFLFVCFFAWLSHSPLFLGAFVVCWTPGLVVLLLDGLNCTNCGVQNVKRWFLLLALLNSVMNPVIYSYKDDEMWGTMKRMLCCSSDDRNQERRSSRIPSTVLGRSTDTTGQYIEDGIIQGTICGKGDLSENGNSWVIQETDLAENRRGKGEVL